MRYYIHEKTYAIAPDGTKSLRDCVHGVIEDREGNVLDTAEQKFYSKLISDMQFEQEMCEPDTSGNDYLFEQVWSLDEQGAMIALHLSITESQLKRNAAFGDFECRAEPEDNMTGASLIGEAVVKSRYSDVEFERERMWKRRDGIFVMEISRRFSVDNRIYWTAEKNECTQVEAKAWAKKNLNRIQYQTLFGDVEVDDDRVPISMMMRKDHKELLKQRVAQDGKAFSELLDEALAAFLK